VDFDFQQVRRGKGKDEALGASLDGWRLGEE
jgi:hypothetical protein